MIPIAETCRAAARRRRQPPIASLAIVFVLVASACSSTTPTASPAGSGGSASGSPSATAPLGSGQPGPTGAPGPGGPPITAALPLPTLTEPFAIGEALYDPTRMDVAVVSLLQLMGVGIYARDGTPIRKGTEHGAGDPWLFEGEVRGLIDMGIEDILAGDDEGGLPFTLSDLYAGVAPALGRQMSLAEFAAAYSDAYAEHPGDLVPQVLLGQPIEAETPLTRVHLWLLYMDGFVGPAEATGAALPPGSRVAQAPSGRTFGTAQPSLPQLINPPSESMPADDWRELRAHLPTLPETIDFQVVAGVGTVHEGHGGLGTPGTASTTIHGRDLISPVNGHVLLHTWVVSHLDGMDIRWRSANPGVLRAHGSTSPPLPAFTSVDSDGFAEITYTPKKEGEPRGVLLANDFASLYAEADRYELVQRTYLLSGINLYNALRANPFRGTVRAGGHDGFTIEWHSPGIEVKIVNDYNVTVGVGLAGAVVHRTGSDTFTGVLTPREDGTWRGTLEGRIAGPLDRFHEPEGGRKDVGALLLPLVDQTCQVEYGGGQSVTVVGRLQPSGRIDPTLDELLEGSFGGEDLILKFYPASSPYGNDGVCAGETFHAAVGPPYVGPGPDGTPIRGVYAAWNDLRFTSPIGYTIHLPTGGTLAYTDMHSNFPPDAASRFYVTVTRMEAP